MGPNRTCLGEFDITMESGLFSDSQVDIWRHNIIGHVCGIGPACEPDLFLSLSYILWVYLLSKCEISNSYLYRLLWSLFIQYKREKSSCSWLNIVSHMIYCQSYFIQDRVPTILYVIWYIVSLTSFRIVYPTILYIIWYIVSLTSYRIEYPTILYVIWYIVSLTSYRIKYLTLCYFN
jgi:hypothetical protein